MMIVNPQIGRADALNFEIESDLTAGRLDEANRKLDEYGRILKDAAYYSFRMNEAVIRGDLEGAAHTGNEAIARFPYSHMLHYNLGVVLQAMQYFEKSVVHLTYAVKYAEADEDREAAKQELGKTLAAINQHQGKGQFDRWMNECKGLLQEGDERSYPIDRHGKSVVRQIHGRGTEEERLANLYRTTLAADLNANTRYHFAVETYKGRSSDGDIVVRLQGTSVVPVSLLDPYTELLMEHNGETFRFVEGQLKINHYYYFRFDGAGELRIRSSKTIFVGSPILTDQQIPNTPKLVLNVFIDGLAYETIRERGIGNVMPNCRAFFETGLTAANCYSTGEWTLPAVAGIFTGKYTNNHGLFHPDYHYPLEESHTLMQEYFRRAGYFTAQFSNNWRVTPNHGYYKGFDRSVYQNLFGGLNADEIVMEVVNHIETFQGRSNFVWMCLEDLHHVPDEVELNLSSQVSTDMRYRVREREKGPTTVLTSYDKNKTERYIQELKRIDFHLGVLFDYVNKRYKPEDYLVVLYSDHGQSFLEEEQYVLSEKRRKVPFMMAGRAVPKLHTDELIETVDILPILLHHCGIALPDDIDGLLPTWLEGEGRTFAFTESLHPGQTYKAAITDAAHTFRFQTQDIVNREGTVSLFKYDVKLINKVTLEEETDLYPDKVRFYEHQIFRHVMHRHKPAKEAEAHARF